MARVPREHRATAHCTHHLVLPAQQLDLPPSRLQDLRATPPMPELRHVAPCCNMLRRVALVRGCRLQSLPRCGVLHRAVSVAYSHLLLEERSLRVELLERTRAGCCVGSGTGKRALCMLRVVCAARYAGGIVGGLFDQCGMPADASRIGRRIALDRVLWPKEGKPEL